MTDVIRAATPADAPEVAAIYHPIVQDTVISFELDPPSVEQMQDRITRTLVTFPWLVIESSGRILGYAYASPHRERLAYQWSVDVSVYVNSAMHRQGMGRRLYGALLRVLRAQGYYTALAGIALPNPASVGLHEAMGFTPVGVYRNVGYKMGRWQDVGWWSLALRAYGPSPLPPRRFSELSGTGELAPLLAGPVSGA